MFSGILQCGPVKPTDSFFDLGGRSLGTIALLARIEERFGVKIHLSSLIESPTVERLAALICNPQPVEGGSLVPFRRAGSNLPLFCVHGVGGSAAPFAELAKSLGLEQPFYGLEASGVQDRHIHIRVEDMATYYITQIRNVQPSGPYSVAGWSSGGIVAFEIARQLQAAGEEVAMLGLLDTSAPTSFRLHGIAHLFRETLIRAKKHFEVWRQGNLREKLWYGADAVRRRLRSKAFEVKYKSQNKTGGVTFSGDASEALVIAERAFQAKPYAGAAVLFRTASLAAEYPNDPTLGWENSLKAA
jgi:thioesterase domain-containing protein/acyl carrier protein